MIGYITKKTLETGVIVPMEGERPPWAKLYFAVPDPNFPAGFTSYWHGEWAETPEKAIAQVDRRRKAKIKAMKAEIERLNALAITVEEPK